MDLESELEEIKTQSLFYWNEPCNDLRKPGKKSLMQVTILILLE